MDREGGIEATKARPTQARNLPGPCAHARRTLPAHKAGATARHNESQMSTGLVSGLPPLPSLGGCSSRQRRLELWVDEGWSTLLAPPSATLRRSLPDPQSPQRAPRPIFPPCGAQRHALSSGKYPSRPRLGTGDAEAQDPGWQSPAITR